MEPKKRNYKFYRRANEAIKKEGEDYCLANRKRIPFPYMTEETQIYLAFREGFASGMAFVAKEMVGKES